MAEDQGRRLTHIDESGAAHLRGPLPRLATCLHHRGGRAGERAGAMPCLAEFMRAASPQCMAVECMT